MTGRALRFFRSKEATRDVVAEVFLGLKVLFWLFCLYFISLNMCCSRIFPQLFL